MDKKGKIQADVVLAEQDQADRQSTPTLVPAHEQGTEAGAIDSKETELKPSNGDNQLPAREPAEKNQTAVSTAKAKPTAADKKMRALKFSITGWLIAIILWQLPAAIKWYQVSPRSSTRIAPLVCASLGSAWLGDADSAYAWQLVPIAMSDSTSGPPEAADPLVRKQLARRRLQLLKITDHYLKNSPADKSASITSTIASVAEFSSGKPEEALRLLEPVAKTNPMIRELYAIYLASTSDFKGALINLDEAIRATRETPTEMARSNQSNLYLLKADMYLAMGQPQQAVDVLDSPDCINSADSSAEYGSTYRETTRKMGLATAYGRLGKVDKMVELAKSISDANDARALYAVAYTVQNNFPAATEQANGITDKEGNRKELLLSSIFSIQGKFEQALNYADAAHKKRSDLGSLEQRLYLLNKLGRYKEALSDSTNFSSLLSWRTFYVGVFGKIPAIHADRAQAFLQLGQAKQALAEAQRALSLNPNSVTALQIAADASKLLADQSAAAAYEARIKALGEIPIYR